MRLEISLFGTCAVRCVGTTGMEIRGAKHRALLAILATAPLGRRTRSYLQCTLWGQSDYDSGHQNLRRALSDLRKVLGADFDTLIHTTNSDVELDLEHVRFVGDPNAGEFLEDLNLPERDFQAWVAGIRENPGQIAGLFRNAPKTGMKRPCPRVTVLPLHALGDDPVFPVLGDWIAEQACRLLSRSNLMSVISHLSSRAVGQNRIFIPEIRETLGVDFLLAGTIRRMGAQTLCDFDFIEADSGQIMWNRQISIDDVNALDQVLENIGEIVQAVARAIAENAVNVTRGVALKQIEDHHLMIAGVACMHRKPLRDFLQSHEYLVEATQRMPNIAAPNAWLGKWYVLNVFKGFSVDPQGDTQKALDCAARALDINPESSFALTIDGFVNNHLLKEMDIAAKRYDAALALNPNAALAWLLRGSLMAFNDEGTAAIDATRRARQLSPIDPFGYYFDSLTGSAYLSAGRYQEALDFAERSLQINDRHLSTLRTKITALHFLGRSQEAREAAALLMRGNPDFRLSDYKRNHPGANNRTGRSVVEALAASGIN